MSAESSRAEWAWIERAVAGDVEAFEHLAEVHRPEALRLALALLGDAEAAEDIAQELLIRLSAALPGFRGDSELKTWVYRVTLNLSTKTAVAPGKIEATGPRGSLRADRMRVIRTAGGQIKGGQNLDYRAAPDRQMCRLYLSMMDKMGVRLEKFGDADKPLDEV